MDQLNIFDIVGYPDLRDLDEEELAEAIGAALGVEFEHRSRYPRWAAQKDKMKLEFYRSKDLICVSYDYNKPGGYYEGGSRGCDTLEEAINALKGYMRRITK